jgi:thiamine-phosphate pyrophosphorylase
MIPRFHGLYAIIDSTATDEMLPYATALLEGGCRILQVRCKDWSHGDITEISREVVQLARPYNALVIINDYPEIAHAVGAHGVHLGQQDGPISAARQILGPNGIIGRSTNRLDQVTVACNEADYIAFGPIWSTKNIAIEKPLNSIVRLRQARELAHNTPLFAIGGITADRIAQVKATGTDGWAVIGAIATAPDIERATRNLVNLA